MKAISLADAKLRFGELIDRVEAGESIAITKDGRAVALLVTAAGSKKPIDVSALRQLSATMPPQTSSIELVRSMRDDDRY